jgi:hypothetical protein
VIGFDGCAHPKRCAGVVIGVPKNAAQALNSLVALPRLAPRQDAAAVVLDFIQLVRADRGALAGDGRHGSIKPTTRLLRCNMVLS